jgi:enolase
MSRPDVRSVLAYEALDSRGRPTVACVVRLEGGAEGEALVPSGASTGSHEARELRDGGARFEGYGVSAAVASVNGPVAGALRGVDAADQAEVDRRLRDLDGTEDLGRIGANAVLAASVACLKAAAANAGMPVYRWLAGDRRLELPMPMINILSGGAHAAGVLDFQDYLAIPVGAATFSQALEWSARVRFAASGLLAARGVATNLVADEGGLAAAVPGNEAAVALVADAIVKAGLRPMEDVAIGIDVAATQFLRDGGYDLASEDRRLTTAELVAMVSDWCGRWPILSIEDPLAEDDWDGWRACTTNLGGSAQLVGDDLFTTSQSRLERGIAGRVANTILIKPNQNGTVSGTAAVLQTARRAGYGTVVSARSGETEDAVLSDLAVGWFAGQIKVGSTQRSERTAKWNRLLRIEAEEGGNAGFAGRHAFAHVTG